MANFNYDLFPLGLPVGRLVQGDLYNLQQQTDDFNRPKVHPPGHAQAGQPIMAMYGLVAYPKALPAWEPFRVWLANEARQAWPQFHDANGNCTNPQFATKIIDGDGKDKNGVLWSTREGFAGHWVVRYGSTYLPKVLEWDPQLGAWVETAKDKVKCGDYVKVSGTTQSNISTVSPGMYINPSIVAFDHEGERIVSGVSAEAALGPGPGAVPPAQAASPPPPPAPPAPPPPAPPAYSGYMTGPQMTAKAGATTYEGFKAAGWTDDQLIAEGMMVKPAA